MVLMEWIDGYGFTV